MQTLHLSQLHLAQMFSGMQANRIERAIDRPAETIQSSETTTSEIVSRHWRDPNAFIAKDGGCFSRRGIEVKSSHGSKVGAYFGAWPEIQTPHNLRIFRFCYR
jgi:hypothetical protein